MKKFRKNLVTSVLVTGLTLPMTAMATNGYFAHGYGTKNKGLAGGGIALPQDAMIAATNPAGMVFAGERMDLGFALFSPSPRSYSNTDGGLAPDGTDCGVAFGGPCPFTLGGFTGDGSPGAQSVESDNDIFLIPHFAYNWMISADQSVGVSVYGNGGMNTEYAGGVAQHDDGSAFPAPGVLVTTPGVYGAGTTGVNLEQLFVNVSYAKKFNPTSSFGVSAILAYQRFEAKGLATFGGFSADGANLTDNGVDDSFGYGLKLGIQSEVTPGLVLAASYQTEMDMDNFDKYKGLFAEQGDFDIPATWTVGLAYNITPKNVLTFDVQKIMYSDVKSIANPLLPSLFSCAGGTPADCLGGANGSGFGWKDMTIYKLGYQWESSPDWTWRAGLSYGEQPIPNSETLFNIIAPAVMETHLTFGFTHNMSKDSELSFAFMHALETSITGGNPLHPNQQIELEMTQNEAEISWAWKF